MSTIHVTAVQVKPVAVETPSEIVAQLVARMKRALDAIAEEQGAFHCEHCGEWTLEVIEDVEQSDEFGTEYVERCARCVA